MKFSFYFIKTDKNFGNKIKYAYTELILIYRASGITNKKNILMKINGKKQPVVLSIDAVVFVSSIVRKTFDSFPQCCSLNS